MSLHQESRGCGHEGAGDADGKGRGCKQGAARKTILTAGLRCANKNFSRSVLPVLVDEFETVAVGIEDVGGVVARVVVEADARWSVIGCAGGESCGIGSVDLITAGGNEADVGGATVGSALAKPEEDAAVGAEADQVRMAGRAVAAVVIENVRDAEGREGGGVERDGAVDAANGEEYVIEHMHPVYRARAAKRREAMPVRAGKGREQRLGCGGSGGLPEFDGILLGIVKMGKAAVGIGLRVDGDFDVRSAKLGCHFVEVA